VTVQAAFVSGEMSIMVICTGRSWSAFGALLRSAIVARGVWHLSVEQE